MCHNFLVYPFPLRDQYLTVSVVIFLDGVEALKQGCSVVVLNILSKGERNLWPRSGSALF